MTFSENEVDEIISQIDTHENGKINYTEFLALSINLNDLMTEKKLISLFLNFDVDRCGHISEEDIIVAFSKKGKEISKDDLKEIFKDGPIDFEKFKEIMDYKPKSKWFW